MPTTSDLLLEKKRYGLKPEVSIIEKFKLKIGMPVQKIMGYIEMSNVKINVNKRVLIPRYETEELVELAKEVIKKNNYKKILDMCSGSGYIGIALKKWDPNLEVFCVDINKDAISQCRINAEVNNVDINITKSNLFEKISEKFDLIVSNPPYLDIKEKKTMSKSVLKFEPKESLFAGDGGMFFYKKIEKEAPNFIYSSGAILFEINPINESYFRDKDYKNFNDINGKPRFSILKFE